MIDRILPLLLCFFITPIAVGGPNVVFIITDDQSWDSLGFMGGKVLTPRIDELAEKGLYLKNFNVTSTVCSPSRYSFLTGKYAGRCEGKLFVEEHPAGDQTQVENIGELEPQAWNLAKILQAGGYHTGFVGKSHVVRHDWLEGHKGDSPSPMETYPADADPRDPAVNASMRKNHRRWCEEIKKYGFDFADGVYAANLKELQNESLNVHNLDWTVAKALKFLDKRPEDKPFFLYFSTTLHHGPAPWVNKFSIDANPCMTGEGYVAEGFDVMPSRKDVLRRTLEAGFSENKAFATWLDDGVGAIVDRIADLGLAKDTLIIFVPDHGSYRHGKATLYDYGMRVPMLLQWEGEIKAGDTYDDLVANIDIAPTLLDLCEVEAPGSHHMDGVSFKEVLFGSKKPIRTSLFAELGHSRAIKTMDWKYISIRYPTEVQRRINNGKEFKGYLGETIKLPYLTRNGHLGHYAAEKNPNYFVADQLYDLRKDPEEVSNLYSEGEEVVPELKKELKKALMTFPNRPFGEFVR